jgi:hypothetical protein
MCTTMRPIDKLLRWGKANGLSHTEIGSHFFCLSITQTLDTTVQLVCNPSPRRTHSGREKQMKVEIHQPLPCDCMSASAHDDERGVNVKVTAAAYNDTVVVMWSTGTGGSHIVLTKAHADALTEMLSAATLSLLNEEIKRMRVAA